MPDFHVAGHLSEWVCCLVTLQRAADPRSYHGRPKSSYRFRRALLQARDFKIASAAARGSEAA